MIPTRIIKKPELLPGTANCPRGELSITCDDGNSYTGKQLAKVIGKRWPAMYEQIRRNGWRHKAVMKLRINVGGKYVLRCAMKQLIIILFLLLNSCAPIPGNTLLPNFNQPARLEDVKITEVIDFTATQVACAASLREVNIIVRAINCLVNDCVINGCAIAYDLDGDKVVDACSVYLSWDLEDLRLHEWRHCMGYDDVYY